MIALNIPQGTPEWASARVGRPTASNFEKLITTAGLPSKQREKYLWQVAGESVTGVMTETYQNGAMQRGIELEAEARSLYELTQGVTVEQVGICYPDEKKLCSCSPDGLVGKDGGMEIKCPSIHTHVGYLLGNELPTEYFQQVQGSLYVTGRKWWDYVSYFPGLRPLIVRVKPDKKFIDSLDAEIKKFVEELETIKEKIR